MSTPARKPVAIVGGGPAGSVAALCLRKLGHEVVIFEKEKFPRYRVGESLLPGTMSILTRLDVFDKIKAANFTRKPGATFMWGAGRPPWTFTFSTPKTAPWVFDHGYQVNRAEYDQILLDEACARGAILKEEYTVTDVALGEGDQPTLVNWKNGVAQGTLETDFVIDASGGSGVLARKMKLRQWDEYYRNMAVWSYYKGGKRYEGDLKGNIFSIVFKEGWIWVIPLKDDVYSVGVVTGIENNKQISKVGPEAFYQECLALCPLASEILETATRCDEVRVIRDWAYIADKLSMEQAFLCGDAGCFIDPLFSQGVHLATYSAMLAAASIDYLYDHPEAADEVHAWYDRSYREAYERYHKFIAAFYASSNEPDSTFWERRKIVSDDDERFKGVDWFTSLTGEKVEAGAAGVAEIEESADTLAHLWRHNDKGVGDEFDEKELSLRRVQWAHQLLKNFKRCATMQWSTNEVRLVTSFKVHPTTFKLERQTFIGDENGRMMTAYTLSDEHRQLFASLAEEPLSYRELTKKLKPLGAHGTPLQIVGRLFEEGFLKGYDKDGTPVTIRSALRFGGVGSEDEFS